MIRTMKGNGVFNALAEKALPTCLLLSCYRNNSVKFNTSKTVRLLYLGKEKSDALIASDLQK